ncbi:hypothetical protein H0H81_002198 [Sphagnurus paluster]|uniref:Uncharacterized protein n=1 Tax=Sphagnurus paluster TaxID=117069 RepID=A0A9P7GFR7_9AGAR|nr:hypothetical protein H0H81_002198 [Sphagnurus paluster]
MHNGKCQRSHEGRIVLPSRAFVPSNTPGNNIKAKINEWHQHNPSQLAAGQMTTNAGTRLYEVNQVLSYDVLPPPLPAVSAEEQMTVWAACQVENNAWLNYLDNCWGTGMAESDKGSDSEETKDEV